jgi:hypothetical protein
MTHTGVRRLVAVWSVAALFIGIGLTATSSAAFGQKGANDGLHNGAGAGLAHSSKNGESGQGNGGTSVSSSDPVTSSVTTAAAGQTDGAASVTTTATTALASGNVVTASPASDSNGSAKGNSNNGTVKIHSGSQDATVDGIDHPNNQPHVSCPFDIVFENFDTGQQVTATLTAQPPSGHGQVVFTKTITLTGSGQGAANNFGGLIHVTNLDLSGLFRQPQQGYHLKLNVAALPSKFKVFWTNGCVAPAVVTTTTPTTGPPTSVAPVTSTTGGTAAVLGEQVTTSTTAPTQVLGEQISRLPRTGFNARVLVVIGMWLLALGLAIFLVTNAARRTPRVE